MKLNAFFLFHVSPTNQQANISQAEYERAHEEYLTRLEMSRAPGDTRQKRLYTFYATGNININIFI